MQCCPSGSTAGQIAFALSAWRSTCATPALPAKPVDEPVVPGAPDAYFATLPTRRIVEKLRGEDIPAQLSYSAGTFVCNNLLYCALHESAQKFPATRCGFVHVPYLPEQAKDGNAPSMSLALMTKALETAAEVIIEA